MNKSEKEKAYLEQLRQLEKVEQAQTKSIAHYNEAMLLMGLLKYKNQQAANCLNPNNYKMRPAKWVINQNFELVENSKKEFLLEPDFDDVGDWEFMDEEEFEVQTKKLKEEIKDDENVVQCFNMDNNVLGLANLQKECQQWFQNCLEQCKVLNRQ